MEGGRGSCLQILVALNFMCHAVTGLPLPNGTREEILQQTRLNKNPKKRIILYKKLDNPDPVVDEKTSTTTSDQRNALIMIGKTHTLHSDSEETTNGSYDTTTPTKSVNVSMNNLGRKGKLLLLTPKPTISLTINPFDDDNRTSANRSDAKITTRRAVMDKDVGSTNTQTSMSVSRHVSERTDIHSASETDSQSSSGATSITVPSLWDSQKKALPVIDYIPLIVVFCLLFILSSVPTYTLCSNNRQM